MGPSETLPIPCTTVLLQSSQYEKPAESLPIRRRPLRPCGSRRKIRQFRPLEVRPLSSVLRRDRSGLWDSIDSAKRANLETRLDPVKAYFPDPNRLRTHRESPFVLTVALDGDVE